jgi:hypothetical protein
MMQDPYSIDIDRKYKQDRYLREAIHERLLRQINAAHNGTSPKRRFWVRIQIIIKVIFPRRESLPEHIARQAKRDLLKTSTDCPSREALCKRP